VGVHGADVQLVLVQPDAAIGRVELEHLLGELFLYRHSTSPVLALSAITCCMRRGDEHDAVVDDGWRLMPSVTPVERVHTGVSFFTLAGVMRSSGLYPHLK
jgi:hypothetical protein